MTLDRHVVSEGEHNLLDLLRELSGRRQDQDLGLSHLRLSRHNCGYDVRSEDGGEMAPTYGTARRRFSLKKKRGGGSLKKKTLTVVSTVCSAEMEKVAVFPVPDCALPTTHYHASVSGQGCTGVHTNTQILYTAAQMQEHHDARCRARAEISIGEKAQTQEEQ